MNLYLVTIIVYLLGLVGVGVFMARRVRTGDDFMVAGRSLGLPVLVGTLLATWIGSGSIIASAGLAYRSGFSALWSPAGAWLAIFVLFFVAGRARRYAGRTVPEILEGRYNALARVLAMLVTVLAYTVITSYQFRAGGMILHLLTGIDLQTGFLVTALFVIAFTALAGMLSVAYTDTINGLVLSVGVLVTLAVAFSDAGGWSGFTARLDPGHFQPFSPEVSGVSVFNLMLPTLFLMLGESNMYGRFFSAKSAGVATRAVVWWIVGVIVIETTIVSIGVAGRALYPNLAELYPQLVEFGSPSEVVIPHMIANTLHPFVGALLLATVAAVIVSTATSFLLTPATNLVHDFWTRFIRPDMPETTKVWALRGVVVLLGVWAFLQIAFFRNVLEAMLYAYTMYGASITPAVLAAFFWKRATAAAGAASVATGIVTTLLWQFIIQPRLDPAGLGAVNAVIPALAFSTAVLVVVSLLSPAPGREKWEPFFRRSDQPDESAVNATN